MCVYFSLTPNNNIILLNSNCIRDETKLYLFLLGHLYGSYVIIIRAYIPIYHIYIYILYMWARRTRCVIYICLIHRTTYYSWLHPKWRPCCRWFALFYILLLYIYISFGPCQRIAGRSIAGIALTIFRESIKNEFGSPSDRADIPC